MDQVETLINTLLSNGLASSRTEAQRMANDMLSTSNKVNEQMSRTKDNYMVKDFKERKYDAPQQTSQNAPAPEQPAAQPTSSISQAASGDVREQQIQRMREQASNPQPVHVQTEFDTPQNDQKKVEATQQPVEQPKMTPEEYAAKQMNGMGAFTAGDLTSEQPQSAPTPESTPQATPSFADEPEQFNQQPAQESLESGFEQSNLSQEQPAQEAPRDFISQEQAPTPRETQSTGLSSGFTQNTPVQTTSPAEAVSSPEPAPQPTQEVPVQPVNTEQASEQEPQKKKAEYTEEEKKLAEEVDLSKVFNFSNR